MNFSKLFPECKGNWKEIDLAYEYEAHYSELNMKNQADQLVLLNKVVKSSDDKTFGGFYEDRSRLWKGFEESEGHNTMIHLGIDFNNLDPGTKVASISKGKICHIQIDPSKFNGWGTKVIIESKCTRHEPRLEPTQNEPRLEPAQNALRMEASINTKEYYFLYGHLMNVTKKVGDDISTGEILGEIGTPELNGGWFPHLHLQVMDKKELNVSIKVVDGYEFEPGQIKGILNPLLFLNN